MIAQELETILDADSILHWENFDSRQRQQFGGYPNACIAYPKTQAQLAEAIAMASRNRWVILPCGAGTKLDWGGVPRGVQLIVSTQRLNALIDHASGDLTVTVEAGMKLADLQSIVASAGQFLALDPASGDRATIGGIIATADAGSWRQRYGGVRDRLLGISFVRSDGEIAKAGGRVVKNVAGYDLMKLFTGSYGTLGIICQATFRVDPQWQASETVMLTGDAENIAKATQLLMNSALTPTAADVLSAATVKQLGAGKGMGLLVQFGSVGESVVEQSTRSLELGEKLGLSGSRYAEAEEADLWQRLREIMPKPDTEVAIACKIGVRPTEAVATLAKFDALVQGAGMGQIHAGSGLGRLRFDGEKGKDSVMKMRQICEENGGFLTILSAPREIKQELDIWGYTGNAIALMKKIKKQFDPYNILSPNRFVGGI